MDLDIEMIMEILEKEKQRKSPVELKDVFDGASRKIVFHYEMLINAGLLETQINNQTINMNDRVQENISYVGLVSLGFDGYRFLEIVKNRKIINLITNKIDSSIFGSEEFMRDNPASFIFCVLNYKP